VAGTGTGSGNIRIDDVIVYASTPASVSPPAPGICVGGNVVLTAAPGVSWLWTPATGLSSDSVQNPTATPTSTTTYTVVVTDANGCSDSENVTVTVNALPVAPSSISSNVTPTLSLKVDIAALLTSWSGTGLSLQSVASSSAQGGTVFADATYIYYVPPAGDITTDSFDYTVVNSSGCTTTAALGLTVAAPPGVQIIDLVVSGNSASIKFFGVPGVEYDIQRATNVNGPWTVINGAPLTPGTDGSVTYTDNSAPNGQAYYRTIQH
jgi:hypothetical protein